MRLLILCAVMVVFVAQLTESLPRSREKNIHLDHHHHHQHHHERRDTPKWIKEEQPREMQEQFTRGHHNNKKNHGKQGRNTPHNDERSHDTYAHHQVTPSVSFVESDDSMVNFPEMNPDPIYHQNGTPDEDQLVLRNSKPIFHTSPCKTSDDNVNYCESIDGYPTEAIAAMVRNNTNLIANIFDVYDKADKTVEEIKQKNSEITVPQITTRLRPAAAPASEEIPLCQSTTGFIFPKKAKNVANQWLLVVNQENMTQGIWTEKCRKENGACDYAESFPAGFTSFCKQKFSEYKLLAINESDGKMGIHSFKFPTCCSCHVRTSSPLHRDVSAVSNRMLPQSSTSNTGTQD